MPWYIMNCNGCLLVVYLTTKGQHCAISLPSEYLLSCIREDSLDASPFLSLAPVSECFTPITSYSDHFQLALRPTLFVNTSSSRLSPPFLTISPSYSSSVYFLIRTCAPLLVSYAALLFKHIEYTANRENTLYILFIIILLFVIFWNFL